jgi:hypothetical protein
MAALAQWTLRDGAFDAARCGASATRCSDTRT